MSGKENAAADDIAAHDGMGDPNQKDHLSIFEEKYQEDQQRK